MTHEQAVQFLYDLINDPFANALSTLFSLSHVTPSKYRVGLEIIEPGVWSCIARSVDDDKVCYSSNSTVPEQAVRSLARMWYRRMSMYHAL